MKFLKSIILCLLIVALLITPCTLIFAHESILDVSYDECAPPTNIAADGEDEIWYFLEIYNEDYYEYQNYHIDDDILEIKYYFAETEDPDSATNPDSMYTWTTDIEAYFLSQGMSYDDAIEQAESIAEEIKIAYASSMEKWNNIYYYTYDESGNRTANKIITVTEGTENDYNLIIYPMDYVTAGDTVANASPDGFGEDIPNDIAGLTHTHYSNYKMNVNVNLFFQHNNFVTEKYTVKAVSDSVANKYRERTGQHELGHVLGLFDVDECCNVLGKTDHHEEVLMGYGNSERIRYATYKDIAGVSITRGFHTDEDHI